MNSTNKTAVVVGLSGQDGSYLADQLIEDGFKVYGLLRRKSMGADLGCAEHLASNPMLEVVEGDITDLGSLIHLVKLAKPKEFYNVAAQSHVGISFKEPRHTAEVTGLGVLNCLEAIRLSEIHSRFYQASTSEMFGGMEDEKQAEDSTFHPRSPYGCAKMYGYWITVNYRESYNMFTSNGILFNHEGTRRGSNFVTRKITLAVARIKAGLQDKLYLGNLEARRDWGWAPDYTRGMSLMLRMAEPSDYVLATGETHSVREFCKAAFNHIGLNYRYYVEIDPKFYRPAEVDVLIGDSSKAYKELGWEHSVSFEELVQKMVDHDIQLLKDSNPSVSKQ